MFSLLRRAVLTIFSAIILILIWIGDLVLWFFNKPIEVLKKLSLPKIQKRGLIYVSPKREKRGKRSPRKSTYALALLTSKLHFFFLGVLFSFFVVFLPLVIFIFLQDLPNPKLLAQRQIPQTTKIYDRNGVLLYEMYASQNRTLVPLSKTPKNLQDATIAIEDKDFYNHKGVDLGGIIRAARETFINKNLQGGSTITQQLIKSAILTPEISIWRKVKEIVLALWSERVYTKAQILEMYFNQVAYGGTAYGVEAASEVYFGKRVEELTLAESAFLAGLPSAPSVYSPFSSTPNLWKDRQREVLRRMRELDFITKKEEEEAALQELVFKPQRTPILAPHFVMYVRDFLIKRYGIDMVERGGLTVVTTLDVSVQQEVERIVKEEVYAASHLLVTNGAALVTKPKTGEILAMVGSVDYFDEKRNGNVNATLSLRPPGSTIKVVTYGAALKNGFTAATILDDSPVVFRDGTKTYSPVNYDGKFRGKVPLRLALGNSINIPAVRTLNHIGIENVISAGRRMGVSSWDGEQAYGLSLTLGGANLTMLDLSKVYGTLANGGVRKDLNPILKITNFKGEVIENISQFDRGTRVSEESVAFILSDILADNNARAWEFGPNSPLRIDGQKVSVKTGTSDDKRDNWTIGYTPDVLTATWVGNFDNSPMHQSLASGITGAAPMWRRIILYLLSKDGLGNHQPLPQPSNVIAVPCQGRTEYFIRGTEKNAPCRWAPSATPSATPSP